MSKKHWLNVTTAASFAAAMACSSAAFAGSATGTTDETYSEKPHSSSIKNAVGDTAITAKVKSKFGNDSRLSGSDIDVTTADGVVYLKGTAADLKAKRAATDLAKNVDGVVDVQNDIATPKGEIASIEDQKTYHKSEPNKTERVASDSWITTKVKAALLADSLTKGTEISVKTSHKVVHLTGTVDTLDTVHRARDIAKGIKHVKSVDTSGLKVGNG